MESWIHGNRETKKTRQKNINNKVKQESSKKNLWNTEGYMEHNTNNIS